MASGLLMGRSSGIGNQLHGPHFRPFCLVFGGERNGNGMHFRGAVVSGGGWLRLLLCRGRHRPRLVDACLSSALRRQRQRSQMAGWRSSLYLKVAHAGDLGKRKVSGSEEPGRGSFSPGARHSRIQFDALISCPVLQGDAPENAIRPTKLGHKNWMFIGGEHIDWRSAVIYIPQARDRANPHAWCRPIRLLRVGV